MIAALLLVLGLAQGSRPCPTNPPHHAFRLVESESDFREHQVELDGALVAGGVSLLPGQSYVARVDFSYSFHECLVSWNVRVPERNGLRVELAVVREGERSPWLHLDDWGCVPYERNATAFDGGRVDIDLFRSASLWEAAEVRFTALGEVFDEPLFLDRFSVVGTQLQGKGRWVDGEFLRPACSLSVGSSFWSVGLESPRLDVPFRSQRVVDPELSDHICSPTSVAMVLAYHGIEVETIDVCREAYDPVHDIYGNWARAVQAAYSLGLPGYLKRFSDWAMVDDELRAGRPLVISLSAREGELTGAPYESTNGQLLVITGHDGSDRVFVNDPAAETEAEGRLSYSRAELTRLWLDRRHGLAYVLGITAP